MELRSFQSLEDQIVSECDLQDEEFLAPGELKLIINDAIDALEANIHKLGREDDYFLANDDMTLVNGQRDYAFPSDIYASKIRNLVYNDGVRIYGIHRMRGSRQYEESALLSRYPSSTGNMGWRPINNADLDGDGRVMRFYPTPQVDGQYVERWYIRNANKYGSDPTELCDIPEFYRYIIDYAKVKVAEKEVGHPMLAKWSDNLDRTGQLMIDTLTNMIDDEDNEIPQNMDIYEEHT